MHNYNCLGWNLECDEVDDGTMSTVLFFFGLILFLVTVNNWKVSIAGRDLICAAKQALQFAHTMLQLFKYALQFIDFR